MSTLARSHLSHSLIAAGGAADLASPVRRPPGFAVHLAQRRASYVSRDENARSNSIAPGIWHCDGESAAPRRAARAPPGQIAGQQTGTGPTSLDGCYVARWRWGCGRSGASRLLPRARLPLTAHLAVALVPPLGVDLPPTPPQCRRQQPGSAASAGKGQIVVTWWRVVRPNRVPSTGGRHALDGVKRCTISEAQVPGSMVIAAAGDRLVRYAQDTPRGGDGARWSCLSACRVR